jgi:hypothetical protein
MLWVGRAPGNEGDYVGAMSTLCPTLCLTLCLTPCLTPCPTPSDGR